MELAKECTAREWKKTKWERNRTANKDLKNGAREKLQIYESISRLEGVQKENR